jgi:hypothetical protein
VALSDLATLSQQPLLRSGPRARRFDAAATCLQEIRKKIELPRLLVFHAVHDRLYNLSRSIRCQALWGCPVRWHC